MIRSLLAAMLLLAAAPAAAQQQCPPERFEQAFHFAFPVYQMVRTRQEAVRRLQQAGRQVVNQFNHRPTLSDHTHRNVTTPNNDTLYSASWLELSQAPIEITLPPDSGRYVSIALMDLFTDHFAVLHPKGASASRYWVVGPSWRGRAPRGVELIRSPTNDAWAIARTFVRDETDLEAARQVQSSIRASARGRQPRPFNTEVPAALDPASFLDVANEALARSPVPALHRRRLAPLGCTGLRPGARSAFAGLSSQAQAMWRQRLQPSYDALRGGLQQVGAQHGGWSYPAMGIGRFGTDDLFRSRVALEGLAALPRDEAIYLSARTDSEERPLDGSRSYRLRVPANVPAQAFWSLSLYEIEEDGRLFFTANPIRRYAIGSRMSGLQREPDGSIVVLISACRPAGAGNWLPAPRGPFALTFRAYRPTRAMRQDRFRLPAVQPDLHARCAA